MVLCESLNIERKRVNMTQKQKKLPALVEHAVYEAQYHLCKGEPGENDAHRDYYNKVFDIIKMCANNKALWDEMRCMVKEESCSGEEQRVFAHLAQYLKHWDYERYLDKH